MKTRHDDHSDTCPPHVIILDAQRSVGHDDPSTIFELDLIDIPSSAPQRIDRQFKFVSGPLEPCSTSRYGADRLEAALKIPELRSAIAVLDIENDERVGTHISKFLHSPNQLHRMLLVEHREVMMCRWRNARSRKAQLRQRELPIVVSYVTPFQARASVNGASTRP
jgi:hypothetical protein